LPPARCRSCASKRPLLHRIVELAEGVGNLEATDVQLESLHRVGVVGLLLRQRRHLGRKVVDECRPCEVVLAQRFEHLRGDLPRPAIGVNVDAEAFR
jgi:hypothetical protein